MRIRVLPLVLALIFVPLFLVTACRSSGADGLTVTIVVDGTSRVMTVTDAVTVNDVLRRAGVTLGELDRVNPPGYSRITDGMTITIVRVVEETVVVEESIPFERRTTLNDGLPAGETRLLQAGVNGVAEVTYRITYEDGVEVARSEIRRVLITPPQDEVVMIGSQGELPTVTVNGTLAYISGGNAWIMRQNSANRRPLTLDGGVDGRVFELSPDGRQLLFTRTLTEASAESGGLVTAVPPTESAGDNEPFNALWVIFDTTDPESKPIRLDLFNILYAAWVPGAERTIIYSTAEPRPSFPGWQANNDLWRAQLSVNGAAVQRKLLLEPSSGGVYGWYGTLFALSPDGITLAWAQPDAVGVLRPVYEEEEGEADSSPTPAGPTLLPDSYAREVLVSFAPRNAYDFVWVPTLAWSPDGQLIATMTHGPPLGSEAPEDSPVFNLSILNPYQGYGLDLVDLVGMWANPQFSPARTSDEPTFDVSIAYLQAIDPLDSVVSRYRLVVMDRDGSNQRVVFPPEDEPGLQPQVFAWSPDGRQIALIHQKNLYLVDVVTGLAQQLTGDGLSSNPRWRP
ncbi:MAG TPA: DUF348 domain-containing protein [Chloroflexi bacterium]|nr:DUF348 domain-containing protein [Chloroflexota bacterium]